MGVTHIMGDVIIPLSEREVVAAAERLLADEAEVIGILFLNSFVNPAHELQAKEIVENVVREQGKDVRVITSHEVAPVMKEHNRTKSLVFQAYAAEKAGAVLADVDKNVDLIHMEEVLMEEGIKKFADPQKALLALIAQKRATV